MGRRKGRARSEGGGLEVSLRPIPPHKHALTILPSALWRRGGEKLSDFPNRRLGTPRLVAGGLKW
jgi:hypothetical protein